MGSMARAVAPPDVPPSVQHLHHSIARPDSSTGSPAGRWPRRLGVAPMLEKAARCRMAAVLDAAQQDLSGHAGRWRMRAIFGCFWLLVLKSIVRFKHRRISWEFERWRSRHLPALVV